MANCWLSRLTWGSTLPGRGGALGASADRRHLRCRPSRRDLAEARLAVAHGDFLRQPGNGRLNGKHLLAYCMAAQVQTLNARTTELGKTKLVSIDAGERHLATPTLPPAQAPVRNFPRRRWHRERSPIFARTAPRRESSTIRAGPVPKAPSAQASWSAGQASKVVFHKAVAFAPPNNLDAAVGSQPCIQTGKIIHDGVVQWRGGSFRPVSAPAPLMALSPGRWSLERPARLGRKNHLHPERYCRSGGAMVSQHGYDLLRSWPVPAVPERFPQHGSFGSAIASMAAPISPWIKPDGSGL